MIILKDKMHAAGRLTLIKLHIYAFVLMFFQGSDLCDRTYSLFCTKVYSYGWTRGLHCQKYQNRCTRKGWMWMTWREVCYRTKR